MEEKHENRISPRFVVNEITLEQRRTLLVSFVDNDGVVSCTAIVRVWRFWNFFESRMSRRREGTFFFKASKDIYVTITFAITFSSFKTLG